MNLGFDLDKVLIDYPPFIPAGVIDKIYKKESNGKLSYRIPQKHEQIIRLITHYHLLRPPISKNLAFIKTLKASSNHKHFLISSRFSFLKRTTEKLIKINKLDELFDELYFNFGNQQPHIFKNRIIQKLKIHRYVDDDLKLLEYVSDNNSKTLFFWLNSKIKKKLSKNLTAITNLSEMLR